MVKVVKILLFTIFLLRLILVIKSFKINIILSK